MSFALRAGLVFSLAILLYSPITASAQEEVVPLVSMKGYSAEEKIGFAFYQLTKLPLPYDDWIFNGESYNKATNLTKADVRDSERKRLLAGFQAYSPHRDTITIRTKARLRGMENPEYNTSATAQDLGHTKAIKVNISSARNESVYFPHLVGNLWIALLPGDLEKTSMYGLSQPQYERLEKRLEHGALDGGGEVDIELVLLPVSADSENPMVVNDTPIWLIMTDMGSLGILDKSGRLAWSETAAWYASPERAELLGLQK